MTIRLSNFCRTSRTLPHFDLAAIAMLGASPAPADREGVPLGFARRCPWHPCHRAFFGFGEFLMTTRANHIPGGGRGCRGSGRPARERRAAADAAGGTW